MYIAEQGGVNEIEEFLSEATIMKDFHHDNVLSLIGVVIENNNVFVVLPFMSNGCLREYIRKNDIVSFFIVILYCSLLFSRSQCILNS